MWRGGARKGERDRERERERERETQRADIFCSFHFIHRIKRDRRERRGEKREGRERGKRGRSIQRIPPLSISLSLSLAPSLFNSLSRNLLSLSHYLPFLLYFTKSIVIEEEREYRTQIPYSRVIRHISHISA